MLLVTTGIYTMITGWANGWVTSWDAPLQKLKRANYPEAGLTFALFGDVLVLCILLDARRTNIGHAGMAYTYRESGWHIRKLEPSTSSLRNRRRCVVHSPTRWLLPRFCNAFPFSSGNGRAVLPSKRSFSNRPGFRKRCCKCGKTKTD